MLWTIIFMHEQKFEKKINLLLHKDNIILKSNGCFFPLTKFKAKVNIR